MDHGYRFIFSSPRMICMFGMAFAALFLLQFIKLPYDSVFTSLLSAGKLAFFGSVDYTHRDQGQSTGSMNSSSSGQSIGWAMPPAFLPFGPVAPPNAEAPSPMVSMKFNMFPKEKRPMENSSSQEMLDQTVRAVSISQMNELLQQSHSSPNSKLPSVSSAVHEELMHVKSEIENAPLVHSDSGLYEPLYHNISKFKRSYDLMDKMLRVYIYKEGDKPIFHDSVLEGIYASEGWFLKLLEVNNQFVTEDPLKAHLFYLPFSSRLLQLTLYVPHSHSRDNLIQFMKDYVEMLIQKHPFWNRTYGQDHFLAACHDWAPAETRGRMLNCLRALCNADTKAGFAIGKDVSLPTVYIQSAKDPLHDIGGEAASNRTILAFFAGYMHGNVRPTLLKLWGKDPDMKIVDRLPHVKGNKNYIRYMKSSKYCICARGYAVHSPRVVESIFYECVPVIMSNNYVPPFFEVLNWESFAVFVLEEDILDLKKILTSIPEDKYVEMQKRVREVQKHFLWHVEPVKYDLFHMTLHSVWYNRVFRTKSA